MRAPTATVLALGIALPLAAQATYDFEQGTPGDAPPGWSIAPGYTGELSSDNPSAGELCALLRSTGAEDARFGTLVQSVDATPYRGKTIRLRGAVRMVGATESDRAQMWFRVDRTGGQMGFFDNMGNRPIRSPKWAHYDIVGDVEDDAETLVFGLILLQNGEAWFDDVSLEILGDATPAAVEPARAFDGRGLDNVTAFARLLGYVRHFHPSDRAAETDWDTFAVRGIRAVEGAADADELAQVLTELLAPIAPHVQVFATGSPPDDTPLEGKHLIAWQHTGFGTGRPQSIYSSERVTATRNPKLWDKLMGRGDAADVPDPEQPLRTDLGGGVSCVVPLTLPSELAEAADAAAELDEPAPRLSGDDRATRLAAVALAWNVFQHFYPYFDVVEVDWQQVLRESLVAASTDADARAFLGTLRRMVAKLEDGHGGVYHSSDDARAVLPLDWAWAEDQLVVTVVGTDLLPEGIELQRGDVVVRIDGTPAADALATAEMSVSAATPQFKRHRGLMQLRLGRSETSAELEVRRADGDTARIEVPYSSAARSIAEPRPEKITELRDGIWYVDIDRINDDDFTAAVDDLASARGVVFDLRGYPGKLSTIVLAHLIDERITCAQWHVPVVQRPDRVDMQFRQSNWAVLPKQPRITGKVAFVIDGRAISYAETYMGMVEHYRLAEIVGEATAGTNGNINPFAVPGGYQIIFTGMKVLKHDGSQHHAIGILPTVPVERTVEGIAAGRDELLEKALEVVGG